MLKLPVPSGATYFFGVEAASSIWCNIFLGVEAAVFFGATHSLVLKLPVVLWCNTSFGVEAAGPYPGATRLQQALPLLSSFCTRVESLPILGQGLSTALSPYA